MSRKTTVRTTASTGTSVSSRRIRYAVTRYGRAAPPAWTAPAALMALLLDPHVGEPHPLRLLVEALGRVADRAERGEVAVADDRHLLVDLARLLLPHRHALLGVDLARHLGLELQDVLVGRPARPARGEEVDMGRVVDGADAGGERVVLLRVVAPLEQGGPVDDLQVDDEPDVLQLLLGQKREVVHPLVLLRGHEAHRLLLVAGLLQELSGLILVALVPRQARELGVPRSDLGHDQARVHT